MARKKRRSRSSTPLWTSLLALLLPVILLTLVSCCAPVEADNQDTNTARDDVDVTTTTTTDLDGRGPPQQVEVEEQDLRPLPPTSYQVHERSGLATRAINSSVNNDCLRDNLVQSASLVAGGAAYGPSLLSAFDCMVFQFEVDLGALVADDVTFTITSATVPAPTPSLTTWRFYRNEIALAADDSAFDLTSEGLSFIMPNCMVVLTTKWLFTITSSQSYMVTMAATYTSAQVEIALTDGVDVTGTWTTTNTWKLYSFVSDSEQAIQTATINFGSSTTQMAIYTQVGGCPTMRHTYQYSVIRPGALVGRTKITVGNTNSKVYLAIAPLLSGYDGTGDVTLGYTLQNSACLPPGDVGLPLCSQWYWNAIGNDTQGHLARDDAAKTFYDGLVAANPQLDSTCLRAVKDFICLSTVVQPCRVENKQALPLCQDWCDQVYSSCPARFASRMLQGELRDSCFAPGLEIRDTKAFSPVKPPINCFHTPIPDPVDIWDFTERPTRNPLLWTLAGFVAYMGFALFLALVAVCAFLHIESKRKKKHRDMTALQQLGLGLD